MRPLQDSLRSQEGANILLHLPILRFPTLEFLTDPGMADEISEARLAEVLPPILKMDHRVAENPFDRNIGGLVDLAAHDQDSGVDAW